jgi:hypothetical protein
MQALSGSVRDLAEGRSRWIVSSLLAIIALGIGIRLYVAEALVGKAFNDTAIVGLMTVHELAGRFYAFYWGRPTWARRSRCRSRPSSRCSA